MQVTDWNPYNKHDSLDGTGDPEVTHKKGWKWCRKKNGSNVTQPECNMGEHGTCSA